jgi:hypothetical protein
LSKNNNQHKNLEFDMEAEGHFAGKFLTENNLIVKAIGIALESRKFLLPNLGVCYFKEISREIVILPELFKACQETAYFYKFSNENKEVAYFFSEESSEEFDSEEVLELLNLTLTIVKSESMDWEFTLFDVWDEKFFERDMAIMYSLKVFIPDSSFHCCAMIAYPLALFSQSISMRN